jgi:hypothetical protein
MTDAQNLAMLKYHDPSDCSKAIGLSDDGKSFGKDPNSGSAVASIVVPNDVGCSN